MQLHCFTGYDANSGLQAFIVRQSCKELRQLARYGDERSRRDEEELFFNLVIYADKKSSSMAEVRATKWKIMNSLSVSL